MPERVTISDLVNSLNKLRAAPVLGKAAAAETALLIAVALIADLDRRVSQLEAKGGTNGKSENR